MSYKQYAAAVEYEVYENGRPVRWGNLVVTYKRETVCTILADIRNAAAESTGMPADDVRIVGMWKLL